MRACTQLRVIAALAARRGELLNAGQAQAAGHAPPVESPVGWRRPGRATTNHPAAQRVNPPNSTCPLLRRRNLARVMWVVSVLNIGSASVNRGIVSNVAVTFGGGKEFGFVRTGGNSAHRSLNPSNIPSWRALRSVKVMQSVGIWC